MADAPPYTTSIDAALQLVPEGCGRWYVQWLKQYNRYDAYISLSGDDLADDGSNHHGSASAPALALCISALRARAAHDTNMPS